MKFIVPNKVKKEFKMKDVVEMKPDEFTWYITDLEGFMPLWVFYHVSTGFTIVILKSEVEDTDSLLNAFKFKLHSTLRFSGFDSSVIQEFLNTEPQFLKNVDSTITGRATGKKHSVWVYQDDIRGPFEFDDKYHFDFNHGRNNFYSEISALEEVLKVFKTPCRTYRSYQLKITLDLEEKTIDRIVNVPDTMSFSELHEVIQILFQWHNTHQFEFSNLETFLQMGHEEIEIGTFVDTSTQLTLLEYFSKNKEIDYVYDFGDYWEHEILLQEEIHSEEPIPVSLISWQGEPVPEDIGGVPGYYEWIEIISDPDHEDFLETMEWTEKNYSFFDDDQIQLKLYEKFNTLEQQHDLLVKLNAALKKRVGDKVLIDTIIACVNYYGIVPKQMLLEIYNAQNKKQTDLNTVEHYLKQSLKLVSEHIFDKNDCFVHALVVEFNTWNQLILDKGQKPYPILNKENLLKYVNEDYVVENAYYTRLRSSMRKLWKNNNKLIDELIEQFTFMIRIGLTMQSISDLLSESEMLFQTEQDATIFYDAFIPFYNQSPKWANNGYSSNYLPMDIHMNKTGHYSHLLQMEQQKPAQAPKVGRNDPCPCGSGKKYKKCCYLKIQ